MKIAVYTIAKDEADHVERWHQSTQDADVRSVLDTGSTDLTVDLLKAARVNVHQGAIRPWRYDDALNASLSLVPADVDVCMRVDMDEVLVSDWREQLEAHWQAWADHAWFTYIWNWNDDGTPNQTFMRDTCHTRFNFRWQGRAHEGLHWCGSHQMRTTTIDGLRLEHHPKPKSKAGDLGLLKADHHENPTHRTAFYLGREYFFQGMNGEAIPLLEWSLAREVRRNERALTCRLLYGCTGDTNWIRQAVAESPTRQHLVMAAKAEAAVGQRYAARHLLEWAYITPHKFNFSEEQIANGTITSLIAELKP